MRHAESADANPLIDRGKPLDHARVTAPAARPARRGGQVSRKPSRKRRKKPPSLGNDGAGGGAVRRCEATGWS